MSHLLRQLLIPNPKKNQNERELEEFFTNPKKRQSLLRHCFSLGKGSLSAEDAEDLTQEVFLKARKNINNFDHKASMNTWLHTIATNAFYDLLRRRKKLKNTFSFEENPYEDNGENHKNAGAMSGADVVNLHRGRLDATEKFQIDSLHNKKMVTELKEYFNKKGKTNPTYHMWWTLLELKEIDGLIEEEIAQIFGKPVGTIKSRLFRAREAAREFFESLDKKADKKNGREAKH